MLKKNNICVFAAVLLILATVITSYCLTNDDHKKIQQINQTLAQAVQTNPLPNPSEVLSVQPVSNHSSENTNKATLTQEKLTPLRKQFSRTNPILRTTGLPKEKTIVLANRIITVPDSAKAPTALSENQSLTSRSTLPYIIHFGKPVTAEMRQQLEDSGAIVRGYVANYAYLAELTTAALQSLAEDSMVNYITEYTAEDKIQPFLASLSTTQDEDETLQVTIQTVDGKDVATVERFLEECGATVESVNQLTEWGVVNATITLSDIAALAAMGEVQWIEEHAEVKILNNSAAKEEHLNAVSICNDWHLTGRGQVVGHADTGLDTGEASTIHEDFKGRIKAIFDRANGGTDAADYMGHGTHTAGSICGSGASSNGKYRGIAYEAQLVSQCLVDNQSGSFNGADDLFDLFQQSYDAGAPIHSDSWGDDSYGAYNNLSRTTDLFAWTHPDFLAVFAAGNNGNDEDDDGVVDLNSIAAPATAKNVLSVGAAENDRTATSEGYRDYTYGRAWPNSFGANPIKDDYISWSANPSPYQQGMAAFSSRGPTDDNRIKPEVCAPGTDVISTRSSVPGVGYGWGRVPENPADYCYNGGTSMSCPLTAGSLVLIRQYMVERAGLSNPSAALMKATIIGGSRSLTPGQYGTNTAQEIPFTSPNNVEGWGQPDLEQAVHPEGLMIKLIDDLSPETGETNLVNITVEQSGKPLDIVLSWVDYPATAGAAVTLINDLNLNVITPGTNTVFPNNGTADDDINTVESVSIASASSGVYQIQVIGNNVPQSGGTAALYIRGAIEEKPIIVHETTPNVNVALSPYPVNFKVQSLNPLPADELTVFYSTGTENTVTGEWQNATVEWTGDANYQAFIPQLPEEPIVHYYIQLSNDLYRAELPQNAAVSNVWFTMNLKNPVSLTVKGNPDEYSTVSPAYGTNTLLSGIEYTALASVKTISSTEQQVVYDWTGTGDIPDEGSDNPFHFELSQDSSLTWNWQTQYLLTKNIYLKNHEATIPADITWYWKDQTVPDQDASALLNMTHNQTTTYLYAFCGWSLNGNRWPDAYSPSSPQLTGLVMTNAVTLQANYMLLTTDNDGDSLYDWWEIQNYGNTNTTDSINEDSDGDQWTNLSESFDNTNPLDPESIPTPPVITVTPLDPFQSEHPPWSVTAEVTDNFIVTAVTLEWKEKGDTDWQQVEMNYQDNHMYTGVIDPASHGTRRIDYRVNACDLIGNSDSSFATVSAEYSVLGDYDAPWLSITSSLPPIAELTDQPTDYTLNLSNLAGPDLVWTGTLMCASQNISAEDPGWKHSGTNDAWNVSTNRTWNEEPVWYCGDEKTRLYPNECNAALDTPAFTVDQDDVLIFRHWMDVEANSDEANYYWDGAVIMISTNNGVSFTALEPIEGYNAYIYPNVSSPFPADQPCFGDIGNGWQTVKVDLSAFAGCSAIVRFQFGSDLYTNAEGWYIGNVTILSSNQSPPAWVTPTGSWSGILPDTWSSLFGFSVDPRLTETNSEHVLCVRIDSNALESDPIFDITVRHGFSVTGETRGSGTISINDPFIFRNEQSTVDIQADYGSYLTNVTLNGVLQSGDYDFADTFHNYTAQPVHTNLHFAADFSLRSWDLVIHSAYGTPVPSAGAYSLTHGTPVTASVTTPVSATDPMTRYSADSMTLEGVVPVSSAIGEVSFVLTNHTAITWNWTTNYQLSAISAGNGIVMPSSEWYSAGSSCSTTGYASRYYSFESWTGDVEGSEIDESIISFTMDGPKSVTATFHENRTPSHDVPEPWLASFGFRGDLEAAAEEDQDGDTMETWKEWRADTNPTNRNSLLKISNLTTTGESTQTLSWIGGILRTQIVQSASTLSGPWTALHTNPPPTGVSNQLQIKANSSNEFYRIIVP